MQRPSNSLLLPAVLWGLCHLLAVLYLSVAGLGLQSDILALLVDKNTVFSSVESGSSTEDVDSARMSLALGTQVLGKQSSLLRFVIQANEEETLRKAGATLHAALEDLPEIALLPLVHPEQLEGAVLETLAAARLGLLPIDEHTQLDEEISIEEFIRELQQKLYSPLAGYYARFLALDPLLRLPDVLLSIASPSNIEVLELAGGQTLLLHLSEETNAPLALSILASVRNENGAQTRSPAEQGQLIERLAALETDIATKHPGVEMRWSGMLAFAHSSATRLEGDIRQISTWGSLLAISLLLYCFRSIQSLVLPALSILSGMLFGVAMVRYASGGIHLLTLGIGVSLLGACIDYSLHMLTSFYYHRSEASRDRTQSLTLERIARNTRSNLYRPILLGVATSALAMAALQLSGFPGLQELAVFAVGSLFASGITVLVVAPLLLGWSRKESTAHKVDLPVLRSIVSVPATSVFTTLIARWRTFGSTTRILATFIVLLLLVPGLIRLKSNDDIAALQTPEKRLLENEQWIADATATPLPQAHIIAVAQNTETLFTALYSAHAQLQRLQSQGAVEHFQSLYGLVPPKETQQRQQQRLKALLSEHAETLRGELEALGYKQELITKALSTSEGDSLLSFTDLLAAVPPRLAELIRPMTLTSSSQTQDTHAPLQLAAIALSGVPQPEQVRKAFGDADHLFYFEPRSDISRQFAAYRIESIQLVALAYLLIFLGLTLRYGFAACTKAFIPLLASLLGTLSLLGWLAEPLSFFSILALLIVLGLSVDFALFFLEAKGSKEEVRTAVLLSAITTCASFGLLALSTTAVLHSIGLTVSIGLAISLLSTLVVYADRSSLSAVTAAKK